DARAAQLATQADLKFRAGKLEDAFKLYKRAAAVTEEAIEVLPATNRRSLALLMVNAAMLRYKARDGVAAQKLALRYLSAAPPEAAINGLREVLFACWQDEVADKNEYLTAFEIGLSGGEVRFGIAPADEVSRREETTQALLWRAAEHEAGMEPR